MVKASDQEICEFSRCLPWLGETKDQPEKRDEGEFVNEWK
jgi:hypothetical protein